MPDGSTSIFDGSGFGIDTPRGNMERMARGAFMTLVWDASMQQRTPQGPEPSDEIVKRFCDGFFGDLKARAQQRREAQRQGYTDGVYEGRR